ncbi:MAG: amidohydrolase family protein [Pseudomonadota bacterium]
MNRLTRSSVVWIFLSILAIPAYSETIAIVGADIHTLSERGSVRNGTLVIRDGIISEIVAGEVKPEGARIIDGQGKVLSPAMFHVVSQLGLTEVSAETSTVDGRSGGAPASAAFELSAAVNPRSSVLGVARSEGVAYAQIVPSLDALPEPLLHVVPIAGSASIIHLGSSEGFLVKKHSAVLAVLGSQGGALVGGSRALAISRLEKALQDAADFAADETLFRNGEGRELILPIDDLTVLANVLNGSIPLLVAVDRTSDIRAVLSLAKRHSIQLVLLGGAEAWRVADEIAQANAGVVIEPQRNLPNSFDSLDAHMANAARLVAAGVKVAIGESNSHNAGNLKQSAGNAVANGMPWIDGLAAITSVPAELFGLGDSLGKLRIGQAATLVLWDGDPLELNSFADQVFINGKAMQSPSRQQLLRDRYLKQDPALPPAYRLP